MFRKRLMYNVQPITELSNDRISGIKMYPQQGRPLYAVCTRLRTMLLIYIEIRLVKLKPYLFATLH